MPLKDKEAYNEYMNQYMQKRYWKRRNWAIKVLGKTCAFCDSDEELELDHIDPKTKDFYITKLWNKPIAIFEAEVMKCQLLCSTCHAEKTFLNGDYKHKLAGVTQTAE